ncbi:MAG: ACT domain-containing protein, partial [Paenibacillus macerans]|nr:ACT domain-containing protein [Paenibacillus macerans]
ARIVQIDKFPVDVAPEGHLIFISHNDKPGIIGNVGTLLGKNDVNIASMQVGRKLVGGEAIMVLTVDKAVTKEVLDDLTKLPELNKALQIIFE